MLSQGSKKLLLSLLAFEGKPAVRVTAMRNVSIGAQTSRSEISRANRSKGAKKDIRRQSPRGQYQSGTQAQNVESKRPRQSQKAIQLPLERIREPSPEALVAELAERVQTIQASQIERPSGITDGIWDDKDQAAVHHSARDPEATGAGRALLGLSMSELEEIAVSAGLPKFRGQQIYRSLLHGARTVHELKNLPKQSLDSLASMGYTTGRSIVRQVVKAPDGTCKFLLQLHDGRIVETVGIPDLQSSRLTVCVSSQVGCAMRCTFCATGKGGFARNLMAHEIADQVLTVQDYFKARVSNVVFMGMGEPMLNIRQVTAATRFLIDHVGIGARHITISTVGVPNAILKMAAEKLQVTLAVSLHAPSQETREEIVPSARMYPIVALLLDCKEYFNVTGRRVTFEYILLAGVNDSLEQATKLAKLLHKYVPHSHVNLIPYNAVDDATFERPSRNAVMRFSKALKEEGIQNSVRVTRGSEAAAACGQLRNTFQKTPLPQFAALA